MINAVNTATQPTPVETSFFATCRGYLTSLVSKIREIALNFFQTICCCFFTKAEEVIAVAQPRAQTRLREQAGRFRERLDLAQQQNEQAAQIVGLLNQYQGLANDVMAQMPLVEEAIEPQQQQVNIAEVEEVHNDAHAEAEIEPQQQPEQLLQDEVQQQVDAAEVEEVHNDANAEAEIEPQQQPEQLESVEQARGLIEHLDQMPLAEFLNQHQEVMDNIMALMPLIEEVRVPQQLNAAIVVEETHEEEHVAAEPLQPMEPLMLDLNLTVMPQQQQEVQQQNMHVAAGGAAVGINVEPQIQFAEGTGELFDDIIKTAVHDQQWPEYFGLERVRGKSKTPVEWQASLTQIAKQKGETVYFRLDSHDEFICVSVTPANGKKQKAQFNYQFKDPNYVDRQYSVFQVTPQAIIM